MRVTFWGTRGSLAKPGPATLRYGGNTSCVEVVSDRGTTVVIDCGTGAHELGRRLLAENRAGRGYLLISHTHWDHIQGIPFFAPLFVPQARWDIMGPKSLGSSLREALAGQMDYTYFPIPLEHFGAHIEYHDLVEGVVELDDIRVAAQYLNHPALTLAYRIEVDGASFVYACDHEPHERDAADGAEPAGGDLRHVSFVQGADLLVHDAQYTAAEYAAKAGWGHSTHEYAIAIARAADVKRLALTHHDPLRTDDELDRLIEHARATQTGGGALEIFGAHEGQTFELSATHGGTMLVAVGSFEARTAIDAALVERPVLLGVTSAAPQDALIEAIRSEGISLTLAADPDAVRRAFQHERPALVILEHDPPRNDALALARELRAAAVDDPVQTPIVVAGDHVDPAGADAGVTDWLVMPFSREYARTKIRAWILRDACRWTRAGVTDDEEQRLAALEALGLLDTDPEPRFDRVTRLLASALDVPIAMVSLVDRERQWFKSAQGALAVRETSRDVSFCAHALARRTPTVVEDTRLDERFADNPLVSGPPHVRFYAGAPLVLSSGAVIGTLCALDVRPRKLTSDEMRMLEDLRDLVLEEIESPAPVAS